MSPIYGRTGAVVAWVNGDRIISLEGQHLAFIRNEAVYSYQSRYLGRFFGGFFRDHSGNAVTFVHGAVGGPMHPAGSLHPVPPLPAVAPATPLPPAAPRAPIDTLSWGSSWEAFLGE